MKYYLNYKNSKKKKGKRKMLINNINKVQLLRKKNKMSLITIKEELLFKQKISSSNNMKTESKPKKEEYNK